MLKPKPPAPGGGVPPAAAAAAEDPANGLFIPAGAANENDGPAAGVGAAGAPPKGFGVGAANGDAGALKGDCSRGAVSTLGAPNENPDADGAPPPNAKGDAAGLLASVVEEPNENGDDAGLLAAVGAAPNWKLGAPVGVAGLLSVAWPNANGVVAGLVSVAGAPNAKLGGLAASPDDAPKLKGDVVAAGFEASVAAGVDPKLKGVDAAEGGAPNPDSEGFGAPKLKPVEAPDANAFVVAADGVRSGLSSIRISPESVCGGVFSFAVSGFAAGAGVPKLNEGLVGSVAAAAGAFAVSPKPENIGAVVGAVVLGEENPPKSGFGASSFFSAAGAGVAAGVPNENDGFSSAAGAEVGAGANEKALVLVASPFVAGGTPNTGAGLDSSFVSAAGAPNSGTAGLLPKSGAFVGAAAGVNAGILLKNDGTVLEPPFPSFSVGAIGFSVSAVGCADENDDEKIEAGMDSPLGSGAGVGTGNAALDASTPTGGVAKKLLVGAGVSAVAGVADGSVGLKIEGPEPLTGGGNALADGVGAVEVSIASSLRSVDDSGTAGLPKAKPWGILNSTGLTARSSSSVGRPASASSSSSVTAENLFFEETCVRFVSAFGARSDEPGWLAGGRGAAAGAGFGASFAIRDDNGWSFGASSSSTSMTDAFRDSSAAVSGFFVGGAASGSGSVPMAISLRPVGSSSTRWRASSRFRPLSPL